MGKNNYTLQMNADDAKMIIDRFSTNEIFLKDIISKYTNGVNPDSMSYGQLIGVGKHILGRAKKIVNNPKSELYFNGKRPKGGFSHDKKITLERKVTEEKLSDKQLTFDF